MSEDKPDLPVDAEAVPLADLVREPGAKPELMRIVEADLPEKRKRKRKPKSFLEHLPPNARFIGAAVMLVIVGAGIALLAVPTKLVIVPVFVTATPLPLPWPTPTAAFADGIGKSSYDYITLETIRDTIPANTRVRLSIAWFDGQEWRYQIVPESEQSYVDARESQLAYAPLSLNGLTLTPSATPWPTFTPSPTFSP
ncbi:MAG: hypothetical protein HZC41_21040 [Chloroflexi bacterium]|nr:hypothetical protein [Chloroflexota bacterium]